MWRYAILIHIRRLQLTAPIWLSGKKHVCKHQLQNVQSLMKSTVKLPYNKLIQGCVVQPVHKSVVAA